MIIGLLGRSRVGKDTVAKQVIAALGEDNTLVTRLSQPLKDAVRSLYGFTQEQVEDDLKEVVDPRYGISPRVCIQKLCMHIMDTHGKDFFSRQLYNQYDHGTFSKKVVIIPDVRYEHDIQEIRKRGGVVIKVLRTSPSIPLHPWEDNIECLQGDYEIQNNKDLHWLVDQVNQILHNMKLS